MTVGRMKSRRERGRNKRVYALIVHKDGSSTRVLLYGAHKVRQCFVTLDYYYDRIRPFATSVSLYLMRERAMIESVYTKSDNEEEVLKHAIGF